jgi:hypothetical protein
MIILLALAGLTVTNTITGIFCYGLGGRNELRRVRRDL